MDESIDVKIAHRNEDADSSYLSKSLSSLFSTWSFGHVSMVNSIENIFDTDQKFIVVVNSCATESIRDLFRELIREAYGKKRQCTENKLRFLFVDFENNSILFEGIRRPLERAGLAKTARLSQVLPVLLELRAECSGAPIEVNLQQVIELTSFSSGVTEMLECFFRNQPMLHRLLYNPQQVENSDEALAQERRDDSDWATHIAPGLRLLVGAYCAGELGFKTLCDTLSEAGVGLQAQGVAIEELHSIANVIKDLEVHMSSVDTLASYLSGRKILFIEDQLKEQCWDKAIPALMGIDDAIPKNGRNICLKDTCIDHYSNVRDFLKDYDASDEVKKSLLNYDLIVLDLYSSEQELQMSQGHHSIHSPYAVRKFFHLVDGLYQTVMDKEMVKIAFPRVVILSGDSFGVTTHTMLKEFRVSDYFYKFAEAEAYKAGYFSAFKRAIVSAVKDNIKDTLSLTTLEQHDHFEIWLDQFLPTHRPTILKIAKYFRYYSAFSLIKVFNHYFWNLARFRVEEDEGETGKGRISIFDAEVLDPSKYILCGLGRANKSGPATLALLSKTKWMRSHHLNPKLKNHTRHLAQPSTVSFESVWDNLHEHFKENPDEKLVLVFIDDFIGSGGQVKDYVHKFLKHVYNCTDEEIKRVEIEKENAKTEIAKQDHESHLQNLSLLLEAIEGKDDRPAISIHVLFAVGLKSKELLKHSFKPYCSDVMESLSGEMIAIGDGDEELDSEINNWQREFKVHVADAIPGMEDSFDPRTYRQVIDVLNHYLFITSARAKERPCLFEPLGWKDCGGLVSLFSNAPGNTLPIFWADNKGDLPKKWSPLFPRFFNPWDDGGFQLKEHCDDCKGLYDSCLLVQLQQSIPVELKPADTHDKDRDEDLKWPNNHQPCWALKSTYFPS